jgi:Flp pilus assembly protein TadD
LRGQPAEARERLERSLRLDPANAGAHHNLGNVLSMLGDAGGAARHYARARELTPAAGR